VQERHRDRVAAGLTKGRGGDLDDPKGQRDLWNFAEGVPRGLINCVHAAFHRDGTTAKEKNEAFSRPLSPWGNLTLFQAAIWAATRQEARPIATPNETGTGQLEPFVSPNNAYALKAVGLRSGIRRRSGT
jgi:hypothetical protein